MISPSDQTCQLFEVPSTDSLEVSEDGYLGPPLFGDDDALEEDSFEEYDVDDESAVITASEPISASGGVFEADDDFQLEEVGGSAIADDDEDADDLYASDSE